MLTNIEGFHEYSGPTYSRTLSSTRDLEITKPLLLKSYVSQSSNKTVSVTSEEQIQINGYKISTMTDHKTEIVPTNLVKQSNRRTTRRELILILTCAFLSILVLIITIIMIKCLIIQDNTTYPVIDNRILFCLTASCLRATSEITDVMGSSINQIQLACNNLERFACGEWIENSRLSPTSILWNLLEEMRYNQLEKLRNILESDLGDLEITDYRWKFQTAFEKCINRDLQFSRVGCGKSSNVESDIEELLQMPQLKRDSLDQMLQFTQIDLNVPIFFKTTLLTNYSDLPNRIDSNNIVLLSEYDEEGMPDYNMLQNEREINQLKEYIFESAKIAQFSDNVIKDLTDDFIGILKLLRYASYNTTKEMRKYPELKTVKTNLNDLTSLTKNTIDFARYISVYLNEKNTISMNSMILLSSAEYFKHISNIVLQSELSKVKNFIRFSVIHKYGSFVSQQFSNVKQKFLWRNTGRQHPYETWQDCIELLNSPGMAGLHQLTMKNKPNRYKILERIEGTIMVYLKTSMSSIIQNLNINQIEKQRILEKVNNIRLEIPDLSTSSLNNVYKNWAFDKNVSLLRIMQKFPNRDAVSLLSDMSIFQVSNGISTYSKLASYLPEKNSIVMSNILLQWPFYSVDNTIPKYLEFASLGLWLAKSIADVFSYKASFYSANGVKMENFSNITFRSLSEHDLMRSFMNLKYFVQIKKEFLNSDSVKSIMIFQMLELAYDSFQKEVYAKEHVLPHLNYSPMQIMFLRLAQNFCSKIRREYQSLINQNEKITGSDNLQIMMFLKSYRHIFKCEHVKMVDNIE